MTGCRNLTNVEPARFFVLTYALSWTAPFPVTMGLGAFVILIAADWSLGLLVLPRLRDAISWTAATPTTI